MEIENKLKNIFSKILKIEIEEITHDMSTNTCSSWDSFNMIKIVVEVEEKFEINLDINEVVKIKSFQDLLLLISNKTGSRA